MSYNQRAASYLPFAWIPAPCPELKVDHDVKNWRSLKEPKPMPTGGWCAVFAAVQVVGAALGAIAPQRASAETAAATLPALNSYGQPPFVPFGNDRTPGLAATFVELLNEATTKAPVLKLENMPRRRLEQALGNRAFSGVALFLAPEFLAASVQQDGDWSVPVMVDENLLVSVKALNISTLEDLHGLKLGGVAGHIYRLLGPAIDTGKVEREDAPDHVSNLNKLCLGRVDFVVISRSELAGTRPHVRCAQTFRPTAFPEPQVIVRRVMVRLPTDAQTQIALNAVAEVACGEKWIAALSRYGLSTVGCSFKSLARVGEAAGGRNPDRKGPRAHRAGKPT